MANREDDRTTPSNPQRSGTGGTSDTSRERSSTQKDTTQGHGTGQADKMGNQGGSKGSGGSSQHR
jgi:hypothetical protein